MTNAKIVKQIRALVTSEDKPAELLPLDVLLAIRLLLQTEIELDNAPSHSTLAKQLASSRDSIIRSQARLKAAGLLTTEIITYHGRAGTCYMRERQKRRHRVVTTWLRGRRKRVGEIRRQEH